MHANNLPRVVTWPWTGQKSNQRPCDHFSHQFDTLPLDYQAALKKYISVRITRVEVFVTLVVVDEASGRCVLKHCD